MSIQATTIKGNQIAGMNVHYYYYPFEYFLDVQEKLGCSAIELWGGTPHVWIDHLTYNDCKIINRQVEKRNQRIVAFTPESTSYRYMLCASEPDRHQKSMEYFKKCIKFTAEIGAPYMCVSAMGKYYDESFDSAWERCVDSVFTLCEEARKEGIFIALKTLCSSQSSMITNLKELKRLFLEANRSNLKAVLDLVSVESAGETIDEWFSTLGDSIVHTHFIDGKRNDAVHYIWGEGCYQLEPSVEKLSNNGYKGYLGQNITGRSYYEDPANADLKNMIAIRKVIKE